VHDLRDEILGHPDHRDRQDRVADSAELAKQAKESHPNLRSMFMSGYTGDFVGRQGVLMEEGFFLERPFTRRSLIVKVYAALHPGSASQH
jgi:hypothetical protein